MFSPSARLPQQPSHRVGRRGGNGVSVVSVLALRQALTEPGLGAAGGPGTEVAREALVQLPWYPVRTAVNCWLFLRDFWGMMEMFFMTNC